MNILSMFFATLFISGCTIMRPAPYDEPYVAHAVSKIPVLFTGKALVVTKPEADKVRTAKRSNSFMGGANVIDFESGRFCRDSAIAVFGRAFEGGVRHYSMAPRVTGNDTVIVEPVLKDYEYRLGPADAVIRLEARVVLDVTVTKNNGASVDQQCDSGFVSEEMKWHGSSEDKSYNRASTTLARAFVSAYEKCVKAMESYLPRAHKQSALSMPVLVSGNSQSLP